MITFPSAVCCRIVTEANPVSSRRVTDWLWRYRALSPPASAAQLRAPALSCLVCHRCDAPVLIEGLIFLFICNCKTAEKFIEASLVPFVMKDRSFYQS